MSSHRQISASLFGFPADLPITLHQEADAVLLTANLPDEKIVMALRYEWLVNESHKHQLDVAIRLFRRNVSAAVRNRCTELGAWAALMTAFGWPSYL
jgi:hypothetical protein